MVEVLPTTQPQEGVVDAVGNFFDWVKAPWTIGDWIKAIQIGAGIVYVGSAIVAAMDDDGSDVESPDSRYNGSPTFTGAYNAPSLRNVVASLCEEAGIDDYDVSLLSNEIKVHFSLSQVTSVRAVLDMMAKAYQFDMVDSAGILKFIPRNENIVRTFTHEDMGFNSSNEVTAPVTMRRLQSIDLPKSVSLTYQAEELDYNNFTQKSEIPTFTEGNNVDLKVPFMLSHFDAKMATEKLLIGAHLERMQYTFKVSYPQAIDLEPGDIVQIPEAAVRIVAMEEVHEGIIEIVSVDAGAVGEPVPIIVGGDVVGFTASSYEGTGQAPQLPPVTLNPAPVISRTDALWIDPPALDSSDTQPRVYAALYTNVEGNWPGAQVYRSIDGGASYSLLGTSNTQATWGINYSATPAAPYFTWDDTTVITVTLKRGTLVSKTDTAVLAGENLCMIGQEVIAFGVATLIGPKTYQLSHLLRGRRGTEWAISGHISNELFIMLDDTLFEVEVAESDRGKTFLYKIVTNGSDLTKVTPYSIQIVGENLIPWTPAKVKAVKDGNNWNITWIERPRWNNGLRDFSEIEHDPDWAGWVVTIFDGTNVKRQEVVYNTTYVYTQSMQISDWGSVQNTLRVGVSQVSNKFGGGRTIIVNS
jgi:hypothetical protein